MMFLAKKVSLWACALCALFSVMTAHAVDPVAISASSDDGNAPENTQDGNLNARWSANGDGVWVQYDFGISVLIDAIEVDFTKVTSVRLLLILS